jgi:predicted dehydrogenase
MPGSASPSRRRLALVGTGARAGLYIDAITGRLRDGHQIVALCDSNPGRLALAANTIARAGAPAPATFRSGEFDLLLREMRPDAVIVTSPDATHDDYIVRALDAGCDALTEKPMATTPEKAQRILDACRRNQRHVRVLFNYRYSPPRMQVKDLLMRGEIGHILSVDFQWLLDTRHGADYFRRWHSHKASSGGLMVHKATHHFDLVNWWLGAQPTVVFASGKREFYTPENARRLGLRDHHERCYTCPERQACPLQLDIAASPELAALYLDHEHHDGYFRDRCVFRPEIDIEDTMNVMVRYDTGATLSYSLNAFSPWEGYRIAFNGTRGRLEHDMVEQSYVSGTNMTQGGAVADGVRIRLIPLRGAAREIEPWTATGGHGGGDDAMLNALFGAPAPDPYGCAADERAGARSMLIGAAANLCFETARPVHLAELCDALQ